MTQFIGTQKRQKTFRYRILGLTILGFVALSLTNCKNQDKNPPATTSVTTEKTVPQTTATSAENTISVDKLKPAEAAQSPLHKLLDSLNVAGQPQWKTPLYWIASRRKTKI